MDFRKTINFFSKVLLFFLMIAYSQVSSIAAVNSVYGISVKQIDNGEYNILVKLNKSSSIKKVYDGKSLILTIPDALPSDSMEINYDNAADLQNITVQKKNSDNTMIVLQGSKIENSQIFTKDISTGITKKLNNSDSFQNALMFINDNKTAAAGIFVLLLLSLILSGSKPKQKKLTITETSNLNVKSTNKPMTLRRKNMTQSNNILSINYMHNGSFKDANMSIPNDFVINEHLEQKIRKAG